MIFITYKMDTQVMMLSDFFNILENKDFFRNLGFYMSSVYSLTNSMLNGDMQIICM